MNYQGQFKKPGQQLNVDLDYARFYTKKYEQDNNRYFDADSIFVYQEQLRHSNPQNIYLKSVKADYTQPVWKGGAIGLGGNNHEEIICRNKRILYVENGNRLFCI